MTSVERILVVGAGGRLGRALENYFAKHTKTIGLDRTQLDLSHLDRIAPCLEQLEFDLLINCAAITNVDFCESHREEAFRVNAEAAAVLARIAAKRHARMFHISTDYVFDGEKSTPYEEDDCPNPISVYGASKLLGEENVLAESADHLNIRVSWVFGPERPSFIDWALDEARKRADLVAVGDKTSTPSYTHDLARGLHLLIEKSNASGTLHLCNAGQCSWREFAQEALNVARNSGLALATQEVGHIPLAAMDRFVAKRPLDTAMSTERFARLTGTRMRPWQEAVREYVLTHKVRGPEEIA